MAQKFEGTIDELKEKVEQAGISGSWNDGNNGKYMFRSDKKGVLNGGRFLYEYTCAYCADFQITKIKVGISCFG